jgi:broad specificity phosphatase PhoE
VSGVRLILVRHGESEWNAAGRVQGQADPDLSALGRAEARLLAPLVRAQEPVVVVSSDLRRAADTARLLLDEPAIPDPRWRECAMGDWTGRAVDELYADPQGRFAAWRDGHADPPGGERWDDMCDRVGDAARALGASGAASALVVTHGGAIRAACAVVANLGPDQLEPVGNASLTIIDLARGGRLVAFGVRPGPLPAGQTTP